MWESETRFRWPPAGRMVSDSRPFFDRMGSSRRGRPLLTTPLDDDLGQSGVGVGSIRGRFEVDLAPAPGGQRHLTHTRRLLSLCVALGAAPAAADGRGLRGLRNDAQLHAATAGRRARAQGLSLRPPRRPGPCGPRPGGRFGRNCLGSVRASAPGACWGPSLKRILMRSTRRVGTKFGGLGLEHR